jgi:hypothetical protein
MLDRFRNQAALGLKQWTGWGYIILEQSHMVLPISKEGRKGT